MKHFTNLSDENCAVSSRGCMKDLDDYYLYKKANKVFHMNEYFLNADDETIRDTRTSQGSDPKNAVTEYKKNLFEKEQECKQNISLLTRWLDDWESRINIKR